MARQRTQRPPVGRNVIKRLGPRPGGNYTLIPNDLIRDAAISSDAYRVMSVLLSHIDGWETSAAHISRQFGWGKNRGRAGAALDMLVKAGYLVIRDHVRDGGGRVRQEYVIHDDARTFSDAERHEWSVPITLPVKGCTETVQGDGA